MFFGLCYIIKNCGWEKMDCLLFFYFVVFFWTVLLDLDDKSGGERFLVVVFGFLVDG